MSMLRLVTAGVSIPKFFLLCDCLQCMDARIADARVGGDYPASLKEFLSAAHLEGWLVKLEGTYCPAHTRELVEQAKAAKPRITPPAPLEVAAFGKGVS
jgi:hypothetical protein